MHTSLSTHSFNTDRKPLCARHHPEIQSNGETGRPPLWLRDRPLVGSQELVLRTSHRCHEYPLPWDALRSLQPWHTWASRKGGEGGFWGRLTLEGPAFPGLKEPPCCQDFHDGAPGPAIPAAMSHSLLTAAIDMHPTPPGWAVKLAAPREASSTHSSGFQSASSGRWGGQQALARPWKQEGAAGPKRPRPELGQHSSRARTLSLPSCFLAGER